MKPICQKCQSDDLEVIANLKGGGKVTRCRNCGHEHADGVGDLPAEK